MVKILYAGCKEELEFEHTLDAFEHVRNHGVTNSFLIKLFKNGEWQDGTEVFNSFREMFRPV